MKKIVREDSANYVVSIVEIGEIFDIPNADKIKRTIVYGNNIIIDTNTKTGDKMLYINSGTKLNIDFAKFNNLLTDSELNKDKKPGYVSAKKLLIKAIKLKGIVSDGILLPMEAINFINENISYDLFEINDVFTDLQFGDNTYNLCEKYTVPVRNNVSGNGKVSKQPKEKLRDLIVNNQFRFHNETTHLGKNLFKINEDDELIVTRKRHGCFPKHQLITMSDGTQKAISKIKIGEYVLGFDHENNKIKSVKVLNTFINDKTDIWYKIKKKQNINGIGRTKKHLIVTPNHEIFVNGEYKSADKCVVGDKLINNYQELNIPKFKESILIGKMIGDGSLDIHNANKYAITYGHKVDHEEYIDYINELLGNFCTQVKDYRISGYGTKMVRSRTKHNYNLNKIFDSWLVDNKKQIPKLTLNPIILAFWYMDDGSLHHSDKQRDRAEFAICAYDDNSCENINESLLKYGFSNFSIYKDNKGFNRLRLNADDAEKLFIDIRYLVPECMQYKLPTYHRGYFIKPILEDSVMTQYSQESIISEIIITDEYDKTKYDIETETHNFFAGDVLVHNSSGILSHVLIIKKLKWYEKLLKYIGYKLPISEYGFIWSSGKPKSQVPKGLVSDTHNWRTKNMSFYNDDIWRTAYTLHKDNVEKGITLYFEITGEGIQGANYTYGKSYDIHIYRITLTNVDGNVYELGWNEVIDYCNKYNLNYCEEYERFKIKDLNTNILDYLTEKYINKSYPDCKIDEGICIRNTRNNEIFKYKSPNFLLFEQKELDNDVSNIEDEQ